MITNNNYTCYDITINELKDGLNNYIKQFEIANYKWDQEAIIEIEKKLMNY